MSCTTALFNATKGKTKRVIWIPVAYAHKHYADILYCSLRAQHVDNYLFFSLDQAIHDYFVAAGRHALYSGKWCGVELRILPPTD